MQQIGLVNVLFLCAVNIIFMVTGALLNSLVIFSLLKSALYRQKLCHFMILVLCCFDLAVATVTHPVLLSSTIYLHLGDYNQLREQIRLYICVLLDGLSMWSLIMLNIERFLGVVYPIFHRTSVTRKRLLAVFAFFISINIIQSSLTFRNIIPDNVLIVAYLPLYFLTLFFLNYKMYFVAKAKLKNKTHPEAPSASDNEEIKKVAFSLKKISTCILVVACYFFCCCPAIVLCGLFSVKKIPLYDEKVISSSLWLSTFVSMNSTFNCLIFFWKNSLLRREGIKILKCIRTASSRSQDEA